MIVNKTFEDVELGMLGLTTSSQQFGGRRVKQPRGGRTPYTTVLWPQTVTLSNREDTTREISPAPPAYHQISRTTQHHL